MVFIALAFEYIFCYIYFIVYAYILIALTRNLSNMSRLGVRVVKTREQNSKKLMFPNTLGFKIVDLLIRSANYIPSIRRLNSAMIEYLFHENLQRSESIKKSTQPLYTITHNLQKTGNNLNTRSEEPFQNYHVQTSFARITNKSHEQIHVRLHPYSIRTASDVLP